MFRDAANGAQIRFGLPRAEHVRLQLYDVAGRVVRSVVDENRGPGWHTVAVNTHGLESGVYFYRMRAGSFMQSRRLVVVR